MKKLRKILTLLLNYFILLNMTSLKNCFQKLLTKRRNVLWRIGVLPCAIFIPYGIRLLRVNSKKGLNPLPLQNPLTQNRQENPVILTPLDYFIKIGIKQTIIHDASILKKQWSNYISNTLMTTKASCRNAALYEGFESVTST